jgi:hypothetical protein
LDFLHRENQFVEFDREALQPFMASQEGPALAIADINGDQRDDIFVGGSKWEQGAVFIQKADGFFEQMIQDALKADSTYEDVDACWTDCNRDGFPDLVVASGGNEWQKRVFASPALPERRERASY